MNVFLGPETPRVPFPLIPTLPIILPCRERRRNSEKPTLRQLGPLDGRIAVPDSTRVIKHRIPPCAMSQASVCPRCALGSVRGALTIRLVLLSARPFV